MSKGAEESKKLPRDPAELSYKEWMSLPGDEQREVLEELWRRARERGGPLKGAELETYDKEFPSLMQEVREEQTRTGIIRPGWIVIGKGHTVHRLIRQLPPGMRWG